VGSGFGCCSPAYLQGDNMLIKGLPAQYRRGIDYGFPLKELENIKKDHPTIDVYFNIDSNRMEAWARADNGDAHCLFEIKRGHTYKAISEINDMKYASANRERNGSLKMAQKLSRDLDQQRVRREKKLYESFDPDRMAYDAANHLDMRGLKGAPAVQISQSSAS